MAKFKKTDIINRLIIVPKTQKRLFWAKETKLLNDLMEEFPNKDFWLLVNFPKEFESFLAFKNEYWYDVLKKKYREFHYTPPKTEAICLKEKSGNDKSYEQKPQNLKSFLS